MGSPRRTERERAPAAFVVGYHQIHPDVRLNDPMNRFSTGAPDMVAELRAGAPKIREYPGYVRAFLRLSDRAGRQGAALQAAYSLRSAEFSMFPDDPRKPAARSAFIRVADDILPDLLEVALRQVPPVARATLSGLLTIDAAALVDAVVERAMTGSLVIEWGVRPGMHVTGTGTSTPYQYFRGAKRERTDDISPLIEQGVLLLAGAEDHS